jgi:HPt (histidine-containing phosphotransfer) domain-containing protein
MIDWDRVANLRAEIGAEDFVEVSSMFLEEAEEVIERLRTRPDIAGLEAEVHFLRGSALNLGFADLAVMLHDKERRLAGGGKIDTSRIVACYRASRAAFDEGIAQMQSAAA